MQGCNSIQDYKYKSTSYYNGAPKVQNYITAKRRKKDTRHIY